MREEREEMMGRLEEEEREQREADDKVTVCFQTSACDEHLGGELISVD